MIQWFINLFKKRVDSIQIEGDISVGYGENPVDIYLMTRRDWIDRGINSIKFSYVNDDILDALQEIINDARQMLREQD